MAAKVEQPRGCAACPRNNAPGVRKVTNLRLISPQKDIFVWAQNPGRDENTSGIELYGKSGQFFWREAAIYGIKREMCNVQNVVRCWTNQRIKSFYGDTIIVDRTPTKEEIHCCSIFTEKALELQEGSAKVHIVLGRVAAKALLRGEYRKDKASFYSERLKAHVFCIYHPAFFLRGGNQAKLKEFRAGLRAAASIVMGGAKDRFSYIRGMDYRWVLPKGLPQLYREICDAARSGQRIIVDREQGTLNGKDVIVILGFCWKPGMVRLVPYYHRQIHWPRTVRRYVNTFFKKVMENPNIKKAFHHGASDVPPIARLLGIQTQGFDFDTNLSEYIAFPGRRQYGLAAIADIRFPEMAGYKEILKPHFLPDAKGKKKVYPNLYDVPLSTMRLYTGGDCDISKRIELTTQKFVPQNLMKVFIEASFVLNEMEKNGPLFDADYCVDVEKWLPKKISSLEAEIRFLAGNPNFECKTAAFQSLLYRKMGMQRFLPKEWLADKKNKPNTRKETLEMLAPYHKLPRVIINYRKYTKMNSTWVVGFKNSASMHEGRVRTLWWLTGTVTSRLRSGGKRTIDDAIAQGIVNLQNIIGDPAIENLLVSDLDWRRVLNDKQDIESFLDMDVWMAFDASQLEIRVLAQLSQDPLLVKYLREGADIHSAVGHELTGIAADVIKKDRSIRTMCKQLHFGVIYGLTPDSLYENIRVTFAEQGIKFDFTHEQIAGFHAKYFRRFSGVARYLERQIQSAETKGMVQGLFGMNRDISVSGDMDRSTFWKNQARNTGIQMAAHQLLLIALAAYRANPKRYAVFNALELEIHDAFYFKTKVRHLPLAAKLGRYLMTTDTLNYMKQHWPAIHWNVPLKVDSKAGFRLGVLPEYNSEPVSEFLDSWRKKNAEIEEKTAAAQLAA